MDGINLMMMEKARQAVADNLRKLETADLVQVHNDCMDRHNDDDSIIYDLGSWLNDDLKWLKPDEAFRLGVMSARFNFSDAWLTHDGYGNVMSTDDPLGSGWIDVNYIADDIIKNTDFLKNGTIKLTDSVTLELM